MADTNTNRLGLLQMQAGTHLNEWGDLLNINIGRVDVAARGFKEIVIVGSETLDAGDITVTGSLPEQESFFQWIEFTGTAGAVVVTVQAEEMVWNVYNNTNGIITFTPMGGSSTALAVGQAYSLVYIATDTAFTDIGSKLVPAAAITAGTVTTAAQSAITSLGTLTTLTVDNITINGNIISTGTGNLNLNPTGGAAVVIDSAVTFDGGVVTNASSITSTAFVGALTGNATTVTTNANLTGHITSSGNAAVLGSFNSLQLKTALTDETGSGLAVFATSPTFITPLLGTPTSGVATNLTGTAAGLTAGNVTTNANLTGHITSSGSNVTALGSFSSLQLKTALTNETGSGAAVFATSPVFITPALGTPASGVATNLTGTAASLTAGNATLAANVTTNANLTGPVTSAGNATTITANAVTTTKIINDAVTFAKMQNIPTTNLLGRVTASTGDVEDLTATQATTILNNFTSSLKGLAPSSGGGAANFLRADGIWTVPAGTGGNVSNVPTPVNDQLAVWTGSATIEGTTGLTYNGTALAITGNITLSGTVDGIDIATDLITQDASGNMIGGTTYTGSGTHNFLVMEGAGDALTTGSENVFIGRETGTAGTNTTRGIAIGFEAFHTAGASANSGNFNIAIGNQAMGLMTPSSVNVYNVCIGDGAGQTLGAGFRNTALGTASGKILTTGDNNTFLGNVTGLKINTGDFNVCIGSTSGPTVNTSNKLFINNAESDTPLIGGDFTANTVSIAGELLMAGHIRMDEEANVAAPTAGKARWWVKSDIPNVPMFTSDTDVDYQIGGGAITFPATQVASADANTLDDYEEGTFTPTLQDNTRSDSESQTYTTQDGFFTKIGRVVNFSLELQMLTLGTLTTTQAAFIKLGTLPAAGSDINHSLSVGFVGNIDVPTTAGMTALISAGATGLTIYRFDLLDQSTALLISELSADGRIFISGTYFV